MRDRDTLVNHARGAAAAPPGDVALLADRFVDVLLDLRHHLDPPERAELASLLRHLASCVESPPPRPDGDE